MMSAAQLRLLGDQRGTAVLELALAAPIFAMLTIGVIDVSNAYSRKLALEQGAHRALEKVMQTTGSTTVADTVRTEAICQVNGTKADGTCKTSPITAADVTVTYRLECTDSGGTISSQSNSDAATFDAFTCAPGTTKEAKYIQVAITNKFKPMFSTHFAGFDSGDGTYHISATAGVRTK
jgi:Flp pilus assembly protein TadG